MKNKINLNQLYESCKKWKTLVLLGAMLLIGINQMWATSYTVYIQRSGTTYMYIWNSKNDDTTWGQANKEMTLVPGTSDVWKYTVELKAGSTSFNCIFFSTANSGDNNNKIGGDQTITASGWLFNSAANSHTTGYVEPTVYSVTVSTESSSKGTISAPASSPTSVVEDGSLTITASEKSGYYFTSWTASPAGNATFANANKKSTTATITGNVTITAHFTSSLQEALIAGSYIMVYGGELKSWDQDNYYFMNTNSTSDKAATASFILEKNIDGDTEFGVATLPPGTYYQGHWASGMSCAVSAGHAYVVRGSGSSTYLTQKANNGSDYLYEVIKQSSTAPTYSVSTTIDSEVPQGGNISVSSGDPGVSSIGLPNSLVYYLYNGSTWSTLTVSEGVATVSALSVGEGYKIVTFLYDGHIYVKADEDEFEVIEATGHTITYTAQSTGWTYGTKPTAAEAEEEVTFVVTPTDGYTVTVESDDVTITGPNEDNEYTFTMPDEDVEITVSASENTYTVTLVNATAGSVTAGCATRPSITASTAPFGMAFDHWDVSDGASVASTTSSTTTVSATAAGTVTAVYTRGLYAFIEGRFHVASASNHDSWTNTFDDGDWNQNSTKIQFAYDESSHIFYLHTYATANALTTQISSQDPVFFIKTSTSPSSLTGVTEYKMSTANTQITDKGASNGATFNSHATGDTDNGNLRINSSDVSALVTLYFDGTKVWYEYMPAVINTINLSTNRVPPGASITATPNMYYKGTSNKAYCWGIFTDEDCTEEVKTTFSSLGDGVISFSAPAVRATYYLRLQIHSDATCASSVEAEKVVPFTVTTEDMVFFRNVPNWGSVHVYFLGTEAYWSGSDDGNKGSGCNGRDNGEAHGMTRIPNTNIFYYDYHGNSNVVFNGSGYAYIAFTDNFKPYSNNFSGCQAVYRGDFSTCASMYVPENYITDYMNTSAGDGQAAYYNRGYWTKYMDTGSGFTLHVYASRTKNTDDEVFSHEMIGTPGSGTYTYTYNFSDDADRAGYSSYTYGFEVSGCGGSWYAVDGSAMTITNSDYWNMYTGTSGRGGVTIDAKTEHTFILTLTGDGHIQLSVDYPLSVGDYRLVYDDNTQTPHPSKNIRAQANSSDIASMFVRTSADVEPVLKVQRCTQVSPSIEWEDFEWRTNDATIDLRGLGDDVSGVYNFYIEQDEDGDFSIDRIAPYSGLYYIRTNSVDGGWAGYKTDPDNIMTYAQYPLDKGYGFNYYKAKWVSPEGSNVTFTIANDYSDALCDTLMSDATVDDATDLPQEANIRFGWNSKTNQMTRAYISGSTIISDRFLVMIGDDKMYDKNGNDLTEDDSKVEGLGEYEMNFSDLNNWIYRADIKVDAGAAVKLIAEYNDNTQYFIGAADKTETILGSESTGGPYLMRVTYDFKTNRLMTAWLPDGEIEADIDLRADMMLIRKGQEAATQITFSEDYSISNIKSIYGVMQFDYDDFVGKFPNWAADHAYEFLMYYISFPFDVKVSEIFGAGVMGENWIVQKYNGAKRAQIGWFQETSTFWETLPADSIMHKHEGYLLLLDRVSFNDGNNAIWYKQNTGDAIYLYFPSMSNTIGTISEKETTIKVPSHRCGISRTFTVDGVAGTLNHTNTDSHWNIVGTPLFNSTTASTIGTPAAAGGETLQYFYEWDYDDNTLNARAALDDGVTFYTMHSYMVQYAGDITFFGSAITPPPASVAARRMPSDKNYRIELQMASENGKTSRTYVELRENACDTFALNEDMYMMRTSKTADLYSFAGSYDVAANVLSVKNHLVPVGIDVKRAGMYRFTMPSEFDGSVVLIDTYTGARTNLALGDYEVNLERGTANDRFLLEINIHNAPTTIEGIEGGSLKDGKAHKFVQDGVMYILRDGKIYDARGAKIK